jgi:predicted CopG family antitoxin
MVFFRTRRKSMRTKELTITLSDDIFREVEKYKKSTQKQSTEEAIAELVKYALTIPPYFRSFDWEKAEAEADKEIALGKTKSFDTVEDLITDLKK